MKTIILFFAAVLHALVICRGFEIINPFLLAYNDEINDRLINRSERDTITWGSSIGPIKSKVIFYLFTRKNDDLVTLVPNDVPLLRSSPFDVKKPTKIIIHGFFGSIRRPLVQDTKKKFLEVEDVNVIVVDWSDIAWNINYAAIVKRVPDVGIFVAEMLDFLVSEGCQPKSFHIVGHSLGAHVAGYVGSAMKTGKPGRITGLDPAKPMFHNVEPSNRLDSADADFVDCIHTCGGLLGLFEPICDVDFYPNGGKNIQPGCHVYDLGRCSHKRSHEYFAESILPDHKFPTLSCQMSPKGPVDCTDSKVYMGNYVSDSVRGVYYTHTNSMYPFATIVS